MLRSKSEIEKRLKALKSREKDGVDVISFIEPLEHILNSEMERSESFITHYACELIDDGKITEAGSVLWVLSSDRKENAIKNQD